MKFVVVGPPTPKVPLIKNGQVANGAVSKLVPSTVNVCPPGPLKVKLKRLPPNAFPPSNTGGVSAVPTTWMLPLLIKPERSQLRPADSAGKLLEVKLPL